MKLYKKLLPLITTSAAAAVVIPMLVSCSNSYNSLNYKFKFERKKAGDEPTTPLNQYLCKFEPAEQLFDTGEIDQNTAWQLYFDKLEKDPSVFADDFLYGASNYWNKSFSDRDLLYEGDLRVTLNSFNKENKRFSWTIEYSVNYNTAWEEITYHDEVVEKVIFNNFPVNLMIGDDNYWILAPENNLDVLSEDKEFSVDIILDALTAGEKNSSSSKIDWRNCGDEFHYYYIDSEWTITTTYLSSIVTYTSFGFYNRPLHYLMNNKAKEVTP